MFVQISRKKSSNRRMLRVLSLLVRVISATQPQFTSSRFVYVDSREGL